MAFLKHKLNKLFYKRKEKETTLNLEKLKDPKIYDSYRSSLATKLLEAEENSNDGMVSWSSAKEVILNTAKETIPEREPLKKGNWFDEECRQVTDRKNRAYRLMVQKHYTRHHEQLYKDARRLEKQTHKRKRREYNEQILNDIENFNKSKESRKFYKLINNVRRDFRPKTLTCRLKNGDLCSKDSVVIDRWKEYFQELLEGEETPGNLTQFPDDNILLEESLDSDLPKMLDVQLVIKKINLNRSAGPDKLSAELLKINEPKLLDVLHKILCQVWTEEKLPIEWEEGSICPIHKKGDQLECSNYRGITLLNVAFKIFSNILYQRLLPFAEKVIGNYQSGFRPGRSTIDQIHSLRQIIEKTREFNISTFHLFIDFKAAYDSVKRDKLFTAMKEFKVPQKLINLVRATLNNVKCRVKVLGQLSEPFFTKRGLRQGDALACILFNFALEKVIRDSGIDRGSTIWTKSLQILAFADDIDIIGRSRSSVHEAFILLENAATDIGLTINESKTKYMEFMTNNLSKEPFHVKNYSFERVNQFKYLGTMISDGNNYIKTEVNHRITMGNKCFYGLKKQLRSKLLNVKTKLKIYKTLIRPIVLYGGESWTLNKDTENRLNVFERRILRSIFGPVNDNGKWRGLFNFELERRFREPTISKTIKISRLRWLGHIWRAQENLPMKILTFRVPEGKRKRGRPPSRWLDGAESDLTMLGVRGWKGAALETHFRDSQGLSQAVVL